MRIHIRRLILTAVIIIFSVIFIIYIYGKNSYKQRLTNVIPRKFQLPHVEFPSFVQQTDTIYWHKNSGVIPEESQFKNAHPAAGAKSDVNKFLLANVSKGIISKVPQEEKEDEEMSEALLTQYNLNVIKSDEIPLNRAVPDSRPGGCQELVYPENLPTTSVVIPFHNEWPSVILRTVYSLINRTPKYLLKEIILVDDASDIRILKTRFKNYLEWNFSPKLVKLIRLEKREGLIRARLKGFSNVTGDTVSFFDSHMEVNQDWLQPLLAEIVKNKQTIAMGQLDYIHRETFDYNYYQGYRTRYGFRWDMQFFETYFRPNQLQGKKDTDPMPGVLMVGPGFVVDVEYFKQIGLYDSEMNIWGGENIELAWRVWMCGGQLLHVPCSKIGHVERSQPYSFPGGRWLTEMHNYKRAVDVWLGDYKKYVYNLFPGMKELDVGNLHDRLKIAKDCKDFSWFLEHVWPELLAYKEEGVIWGQVKNVQTGECLDNADYVFQAPRPLTLQACQSSLKTQGFAINSQGRFRTTIHCVVAKQEGLELMPFIENCFLHEKEVWKYNEHQQLVHITSDLCLQSLSQGAMVLLPCDKDQEKQKWVFENEGLLELNN